MAITTLNEWFDGVGAPVTGERFVGKRRQQLATYICKNANVNPYKGSTELSDKEIKVLADKIKHFTFNVNELINSDNAQATSGGVALSEVDSKTMKSLKNENVYFAGEVLDVVGKCGGYNLQFAFSSGFIAGCLK